MLSKAEEMELKKRKKSHELLDDENFVHMLFVVKDRFVAQVRNNYVTTYSCL